jgi:hypothetical protein
VQEPLLYRCSLTARIAWCYQTLHAKAPFRTLFHVLAPKMDFSITSGQVPLLYRLHFLLRDLIDGEVGPPRETAKDQEEEEDGTAAEGGQADSGNAEEGASASSIGRCIFVLCCVRPMHMDPLFRAHTSFLIKKVNFNINKNLFCFCFF